MRFSLILAAASFPFAGAAHAGDFFLSTTLGYESRYVFRGVQYSESTIQPGVTVGLDGFYLTAWANLPIGDSDFAVSPEWQELDLVAGWSGALGDVATLDVGVTYYVYPNRMSGFGDVFKEDGSGLGANTVEPFIGLAFTAPLSPKLYLYHDFMFDTTTLQGSLAHSFPLAETLGFDLGGIVGYVVDDSGGTDYLYGHAAANVSYALSPSASAYIGVRYGGSDIVGGSIYDDGVAGTTDPSGFWWGIGFTAKF
ncbi:MAG: hypothetical protein HXY23_10605 [Parvularculaceae bacterium]|nr:hypothetical protein [Parvularculaceae bacterium]